MRIRSATCLLILLVMVSLPSRADFFDIGRLGEACTRNEDLDEGVCLGYIAAIADTLLNGNSISGLRACLPPKTGLFSIMDAAIKAIKEFEHMKSFSAEHVVAWAIAKRYPCKE